MSNASTIKYSPGAGVDWAALIAGLGLGLTVAMQLTSMSRADIASPYAAITSFSRLCALVGTYFAVLGIFLIARIPFVERGVGQVFIEGPFKGKPATDTQSRRKVFECYPQKASEEADCARKIINTNPPRAAHIQ